MRRLLALLPLLFLCCPLLAQEDMSIEHCISREDLLKMVHYPVSDPNSTELLDLLDAKGYQCGLDVRFFADTIESIVMEYKCQVYYDKVDGRLVPTVYVYEAKDSLPNIIVLQLNHDRECAAKLISEFVETGYLYDGQAGSYSGRDGFGSKNGIYDVSCSADNGVLTFRYKSAIDEYVNGQIGIRTAKVNRLKRSAEHHSDNFHFYRAYSFIDSAIGVYPPLDEMLYELRKDILSAHRNYYFDNLREAVNKRGDFAGGISWCDSLIVLTPDDDSVIQIRNVLEDQSIGKTQLYSIFSPDSYWQTIHSLDTILNQEIRQNRFIKHQTLQLDFSFSTTNENNSSGAVHLNTYRLFLQSHKSEKERNLQLQLLIDELASSDLIQPIYNYGIAINTHETLNATVDCYYKEIELDERSVLTEEQQSFMDTIEKRFFIIPDPARPGQTLKRIPYHREYIFGITSKLYDGKTYTDVYLHDFTTSNVFSWMPSLIIPGLGTTMQGYRSSVASRAFPFFLFGGLAITGYLLEHNGKQKTPWNESGQVWEHKNFGNALMIGCGVIAVSIYVTDLIQSVNATIQNIKRSKQLRHAMRSDGEVVIKTEDVHLKELHK